MYVAVHWQSVSTPPAARPQARPQAVEQPRPFVCTYGGGCIAAFKTVTARAAHVRTHTGEKPYKCVQPERVLCFRRSGASGTVM